MSMRDILMDTEGGAKISAAQRRAGRLGYWAMLCVSALCLLLSKQGADAMRESLMPGEVMAIGPMLWANVCQKAIFPGEGWALMGAGAACLWLASRAPDRWERSRLTHWVWSLGFLACALIDSGSQYYHQGCVMNYFGLQVSGRSYIIAPWHFFLYCSFMLGLQASWRSLRWKPPANMAAVEPVKAEGEIALMSEKPKNSKQNERGN